MLDVAIVGSFCIENKWKRNVVIIDILPGIS